MPWFRGRKQKKTRQRLHEGAAHGVHPCRLPRAQLVADGVVGRVVTGLAAPRQLPPIQPSSGRLIGCIARIAEPAVRHHDAALVDAAAHRSAMVSESQN